MGAVTCSQPGGGREARGGRTQGRIIPFWFFFFPLERFGLAPGQKQDSVVCHFLPSSHSAWHHVGSATPSPAPGTDCSLFQLSVPPRASFPSFLTPFYSCAEESFKATQRRNQAGRRDIFKKQACSSAEPRWWRKAGRALAVPSTKNRFSPCLTAGGSWSCVLCIPDPLNVKSAVFLGSSPGWEE